ncbi:MAG: MauE/DoxX family redox-associated membrane protein [Myxococcota bacterium]|nr:MauE/DoxX family redox-associated membrane protein [Myxococcota bacterium]
MTIDPLVAATLRVALALLLAAAGLHKLRDRDGFREALRGYRLLPEAGVAPLALAAPGIEGALAGLLLWPESAPGAAAAIFALISVYSAAIAVNLVRGRTHIDCGCFGPAGRQTLSGWLLVRNAVVLAGAAAAALPSGLRPLVWLDAFTLAAAVLGLVLLWLAAGQLAAEWPELRRLRRSP